MSGVPASPPPSLGVWRRRVNPRILDRIMDTSEAARMRRRVCAQLGSDVVEIGFGSGHNLPHLPPAVERIRAVEPVARSVELAPERIEASGVDVEHIGWDACRLPLDDASVDDVLCTWSLCSIDDPRLAVAEVARVLRPGGRFHFVEHGRADDRRVRRWQRRCDPVWSRLSCGCHLDRDILAILRDGGLPAGNVETYFANSGPKIMSWTFEGTATKH